MLLDDIYVMWIPVLVIALMAAIGYWRGAYRELIVSASIVLSALVAVQWATQERWARDLSTTFSGLDAGKWQFFLTLVLMALIVAVVGYGLGGLFARRPLTSGSRTLGAILGLANGGALCGWVLRAAYEGLVNRQDTSAVYQNPISLSLMVWAGWFPVALAVLGAVGALIYSLAGDRTTVVATVPSAGVNTLQQQQRDTYVPPVYQPIVIPPAQARVDHFTPVPAETLSDAYSHSYSNVFAPDREQAAMAPTVANPIVNIPNYNTNYDVAPAQMEFAHEALPVRPVSNSDAAGNAGLAGQSAEPVSSGPVPHTPPFGYDLAALWSGDSAEKTTNAGNTGSGTTEAQHLMASEAATATTQTERRCAVCDSVLPPGAAFCTECGTRVVGAA